MSETNDQSQTDEKKPGGTLDLNNVSVNTLKDDLEEKSGQGEAKDDKAGWLSFLAKHKKEDQPPAAPVAPPAKENLNPGQEAPSPAGTELAGGSLDQALDQFKAESEKSSGGGPTFGENKSPGATEAPANLPISSDSPGLSPESPANETAEEPALGSFFPPKESPPEDADEDEEKPTIAHLAPPLNNQGTEAAEGVKVAKMTPSSMEIVEENPNPFSSRLQKKEAENKPLLQSVESALNYSAPPEFSEQRENQGTEADSSKDKGQVVDLRERAGGKAGGGLLKNKKTLIIAGGAVGLVIILIVILAVSLGGGSKKPVANANLNTNQANKNQNGNPVAQLNTNAATQPKPVALSAQKFLPTTIEKSVASINAVAQEIQTLREGQPVSKQTQLIFTKSGSDGSVISFQDLDNATGMNIPQKVLAQSSATPAMVFADFFQGQTILGLVIPTTDSPETALSKMESWENTMVLDLDYLWEGIDIDNKGAYFADSQAFKNARFALIDKRTKLSLDYAVDNGYILITCGKSSMTVLKNNFISGASGSAGGAAGSGIQWEGSETVTTSGLAPGVGTTTTNTSTSTANTSSPTPDVEVNIQDDSGE